MTAPYSIGRAVSLSGYAGSRPPPRTAADYLAIAVGPVLIMVLVGSLNFFLVEIGYRGGFTGQVYWTLFWFTIASVLVSRIAVEHNSAYAALYGLALAAATGLRICAFLDAPVTALLLLASTWWFASKLTWDCTVIDDRDDASGEGLLQVAKLDPSNPSTAGAGAATTDSRAAPLPLAPPSNPASHSRRSEAQAFDTDSTRPTRPHSPGLWLIYFSLGALPFFALGQWTIPIADSAARFRAFVLCSLFVTAALTLLFLTSFLGLRRYLRQRRLAMPSPMARAWITTGTAIVLAVLFLALLLPRPRGIDALAGLAAHLRLHDRAPTASRFAWKKGEAASGEGRRIGTRPPSQAGPRPGTEPSRDPAAESPSDAPSTDNDSANASEQAADRRTAESSREPGRTARQAESSASGTPSTSSPDVPPLPENLGLALRAFSLLLALVVAAFVLYRFGPAWWEAWRQRRAARPGRSPASSSRRPAPRPAFAAFANPFTTGQADRFSPEQLTAYTFNALESWAADAGRARLPDQTPMEFGQRLARDIPDLAPEILGTIRLYARLAYGANSPSPESTDVLRRLWSSLRP